jgi:hypothetical protein
MFAAFSKRNLAKSVGPTDRGRSSREGGTIVGGPGAGRHALQVEPMCCNVRRRNGDTRAFD